MTKMLGYGIVGVTALVLLLTGDLIEFIVRLLLGVGGAILYRTVVQELVLVPAGAIQQHTASMLCTLQDAKASRDGGHKYTGLFKKMFGHPPTPAEINDEATRLKTQSTEVQALIKDQGWLVKFGASCFGVGVFLTPWIAVAGAVVAGIGWYALQPAKEEQAPAPVNA